MWNGLGEEIWDQSSLEALSAGSLIVLSNTCLGGTWNSVKWGGGGNLENHFSFLDLHVFICGLRRRHEKLFRKVQTKILQTDEETMTSYLMSLFPVQQCAQTACASKIILQPHFLKRGLPKSQHGSWERTPCSIPGRARSELDPGPGHSSSATEPSLEPKTYPKIPQAAGRRGWISLLVYKWHILCSLNYFKKHTIPGKFSGT